MIVLVATFPVTGEGEGARNWRLQSTESLVRSLAVAAGHARIAATLPTLVALGAAISTSL
jgi:hypothetical protein